MGDNLKEIIAKPIGALDWLWNIQIIATGDCFFLKKRQTESYCMMQKERLMIEVLHLVCVSLWRTRPSHAPWILGALLRSMCIGCGEEQWLSKR